LDLLLGNRLARSTEGVPSAQAKKTIAGAVALIADDERRVCLQLAFLRRFPKMRTPCCSLKMCFKCKVSSWHSGISCEARQSLFTTGDDGVQSCPGCGVPTQRTEGCMQVQCVCGQSWEWQRTEEDKRLAERYWAPLPLASLALPHVDASFLQSLIDRKADLSAVRQSDQWSAAHFAAAAPASGEMVKPPPSDASRLKSLLQIQTSIGIDINFDAADVDGDTPLSVAVAADNADAVRFLILQGCRMTSQVFASLQDWTIVQSRLEIRELLRPLLQSERTLEDEVVGLPLWLEFGVVDKALVALASSGVEDGETVAKAFVWGNWQSGTSSNLSAIEPALQAAVGEQTWKQQRQEAATAMLWRALESGWPEYQISGDALAVALAHGADACASNEEGMNPIRAALERQAASALELLLNAGVSPDFVFEDDCVGLMQLVFRDRAREVVKALAPHVDKHYRAGDMPLWLSLKMSLASRTEAALQAEPGLAAPSATELLQCELMGNNSGGALATARKALQARAGNDTWNATRKNSATALLLFELRQAINFESDPDVPSLRRLLIDFGAEPNAFPETLPLDFQELTKASGHGESLTPLMLLAVNAYCSPTTSSELVELLIHQKADPDQPDEDGDTALFWALLHDNAPVAEALTRAGAAITDSSIDFLQTWTHPGTLQPLAIALRPQLLRRDPTGLPSWMKVQFGIGTTPDMLREVFEGWTEGLGEELAVAVMLARFCFEHSDQQSDIVRGFLGEEIWPVLQRVAAQHLLVREVSGASGGKWVLDTSFVMHLLDVGADVNTLIELDGESDQELELDNNSEDQEDVAESEESDGP